jgi:hypothetical protein
MVAEESFPGLHVSMLPCGSLGADRVGKLFSSVVNHGVLMVNRERLERETEDTEPLTMGFGCRDVNHRSCACSDDRR